MRIAVVTGASSGLGRELVLQLCAREKPEEIWVVARRADRLRLLEKEVGVPLRLLPMDLTKAESIRRLDELLSRERPDVRILINAAGFGKIGNYRGVALQDACDIIDLNCRALVAVTQTVLPYMKRGSHILQISSSSAFQPLPFLNVYAASKAFVLHYSRALRWEVRERGIGVTAVCPYWIKDTQFIPIAKETADGGAIRRFPLASRAGHVAKQALRDMRRNDAVSTPGIVPTLQRAASKLLPHELVMACWESLRRM